jgi:hypothetical protein
MLFTLATLTACGSPGSGEHNKPTSGKEVGDRLDKAAAQSAPTAKRVLEDAADEARRHPSMAPVDQPSSFAQDAMAKAGAAEASANPDRSAKQ